MMIKSAKESGRWGRASEAFSIHTIKSARIILPRPVPSPSTNSSLPVMQIPKVTVAITRDSFRPFAREIEKASIARPMPSRMLLKKKIKFHSIVKPACIWGMPSDN